MARLSARWMFGAAALCFSVWCLVALGDRLYGESTSPLAVSGAMEPTILVAATATHQSASGLDQGTRRRIYEHLLAIPGNHFRSIARALGLGMGVTRYHLGVLIAANLVYADKSAGRIRYYVKTPTDQIEMNCLYAKHWEYRDIRGRILRAVQAMQVATPAKVARTVGISRQLAAYHLAQLEKAGVVRRKDAGYRPVEAAPTLGRP